MLNFNELSSKIKTDATPLFADYGDLLTVSDIAQITHQSEQTIRRLMATQELPIVKIGARWYTPKSKLIEHIERMLSNAC